MANQDNRSGASDTKKRQFRQGNRNLKKGGKANTNKKYNNKPKVTVRELKFHLHDSDARKTSESFEKIKETIVLKIQKTFEKNANLATSIETGVRHEYAAPMMRTSTHDTPEVAARENRMYEIEYQAKIMRHTSQVEEFDNN